MSGRRDPSMSASRANSSRPLCGDGLTKVTNARDSLGRDHRRPVDRRLDRRADQSHLLAVDVGQELAAREGVIDVARSTRLVVAEAANGKRGGDAARARARHRLEDHRVPVAGDQLVGREVVQQAVEQRQELRGLRAIGPRFVVVARQQQRHGHALDGVVHDRAGSAAPLRPRPIRRPPAARGCERQRARPAAQVLFDGEGHALSKRAVVRMWHA